MAAKNPDDDVAPTDRLDDPSEASPTVADRRKSGGHTGGGDDLATAATRRVSSDAPTPRAETGLPARIGPYEVTGRLGRGGMGDVLSVRDHRFDRELALKRLAPYPATALHQQLFVSEMQVTAGLEHPHIVPVHDRGTEADGRPYFVMPVLRGRRLKDVITDDGGRRTTLTDLLHVFLKVAEAVDYAHRRGVLHLDLKPANIFCGESDSVYVLDWGIARVLDSAGTATAAPMGTPRFMAPEQLRPELGPLSPRTDVYGLGALLYAMATRRSPPTAGQALRLEDRDGRALPTRLQIVIERAMAHQPADRHQTVAELTTDVRDFFAAAPYVILVHREVQPEHTEQYRAWAEDIGEAAAALPGHQSMTHVELPRRPGDETVGYLLIGRFASAEHAEAFDASEARARLVKRASDEGWTTSSERLDAQGREAWIKLPG